METARSIREDFLQQDAFSTDDAYSPLKKQFKLVSLILSFYHKCQKALESGVTIDDITSLPVIEKIGRAKTIAPDIFDAECDKIIDELDDQLSSISTPGIKKA
ncbi:V-type ATP synthase alpha chain [bioreactor metagenome]|uniref:V-type ATP synthase alpha chain n=1 Tax=bioreactor metagenome TaxID=1076179 RepID=A0A645DWW6_9ZZZZ